jgi:methylenetetrahydrofolate reductase (NADPH)
MTSNRFSFEFFPPRSAAGERKFWRALGQLETFDPAFVSITFGALGSGQLQSLTTVAQVAAETATPVAAHLTFEGSTRDEVRANARQFLDAGVTRLVALRGDAREDAQLAEKRGTCYQSVAQMIGDLKSMHDFDISVACYPEVHQQAVSAQHDLMELKAKADAGAARAISQFFFDADDFARFRDRVVAAGIDLPLVAGLLPIRDFDRACDFAASCGARVPARLRALFAATVPADRERVGLEELERLTDRLISHGCHDFHLYTLNRTLNFRQLKDSAAGATGQAVAAA